MEIVEILGYIVAPLLLLALIIIKLECSENKKIKPEPIKEGIPNRYCLIKQETEYIPSNSRTKRKFLVKMKGEILNEFETEYECKIVDIYSIKPLVLIRDDGNDVRRYIHDMKNLIINKIETIKKENVELITDNPIIELTTENLKEIFDKDGTKVNGLTIKSKEKYVFNELIELFIV